MSSDTTPRVTPVDEGAPGRLDEETISEIEIETRRGRGWWLWGTIAIVAVGGAAFGLSNLGSSEEPAPVEQSSNTSEVVRTDLADETTFEATLGRPVAGVVTAGVAGTVTWVPDAGTIIHSGETLFAIDDTPFVMVTGDVPAYRDFRLGTDETAISAGSSGVITWLADAGTILSSGDVVARLDDVPLVVLDGELPMYRRLSDGVEGPDVEQLEQALVDLGYDPDGNVTIDEEFTYYTGVMVEAWQGDLGIDETGRVEVGDVVFLDLPGQVLSLQGAVGSSTGQSGLLLTVSAGDFLEGADVRQLEVALDALGYPPGPIDGVYDESTASAVSAWTNDIGHGQDGYLPVGSIVFNDGDLRSASVYAEVGTAVAPSSPVIDAADVETIVRLDLPAEDQDLLAVGSSVVIVMPDYSETTGTVSFVASVATAGVQGAGATFAVEIDLDDPGVAEGLDEAPVDVRAVSEAVENVVAVPVSALLALAEGGYAVELVEGGATRLVAVEPGFFADGLVEITGAVEVGDTVVVP